MNAALPREEHPVDSVVGTPSQGAWGDGWALTGVGEKRRVLPSSLNSGRSGNDLGSPFRDLGSNEPAQRELDFSWPVSG